MRKLFVLASLALLVATPAALAKERNVQLIGAPTAPRAGQAWNLTIKINMDGHATPGKTPTVRIVNLVGRAISVRSQSTSAPGIYRARVVFPRAGTWRVIVVDNMTGRAYGFKRMRVRAG